MIGKNLLDNIINHLEEIKKFKKTYENIIIEDIELAIPQNDQLHILLKAANKKILSANITAEISVGINALIDLYDAEEEFPNNTIKDFYLLDPTYRGKFYGANCPKISLIATTREQIIAFLNHHFPSIMTVEDKNTSCSSSSSMMQKVFATSSSSSSSLTTKTAAATSSKVA